jgi:hypothetical protein
MNSKAQIWSLDVMVGTALFLTSIMIFFIYSFNQPSEARESLDLLTYDARSVAQDLLSEGYPTNWTSSNVTKIGLTTSNKINQSKLQELYNMIHIQGNYQLAKNKFQTGYDFYFFLSENMTVSTGPIQGIGKPGTTPENIDAKDLIKITRYTIYQNKTTPLYLYLWQE